MLMTVKTVLAAVPRSLNNGTCVISVTYDPGSNPDQKYARRIERQITFGRIKYNLGLQVK